MTLNYSYPLVAKLFYVVDGLTHLHQVGLAPAGTTMTQNAGEPPADYALGGATWGGDFEAWAQNYVNGQGILGGTMWGIRNFLATATTIDRVELWRFGVASNTGQYLSTVPFGVGGYAVGSYTDSALAIATMRSADGGILRHTLVEARQGDVSGQYGFSVLPPEVRGFFNDQLFGVNAPIISKGGAKPIAFIKMNYSQSEAIFKARHRA